MIVRRPRADEPAELWPGTDYPHDMGGVSSNVDPLMTDAERKRQRKELREALRRKRPMGFQARWND